MLALIEREPSHLASDLQARLDASAARIRSLAAGAVENGIEIGRELAAVRGMLPHGSFRSWLAAEFGMSRATAYRYMEAAERAPDCLNLRHIRLGDLYGVARASPADDDLSPHDGDEPEPRPQRESATQALIAALRAELEAVRALAEDARLVAAMLGETWHHFVAQARALDRSRRLADQTVRVLVTESPALDEVQRRRLLLLEDETLDKLAAAWATPFTTSARVFSEMQGHHVSFDQVRYYQKIHEWLRRAE
jgi:hypothetical protein